MLRTGLCSCWHPDPWDPQPHVGFAPELAPRHNPTWSWLVVHVPGLRMGTSLVQVTMLWREVLWATGVGRV